MEPLTARNRRYFDRYVPQILKGNLYICCTGNLPPVGYSVWSVPVVTLFDSSSSYFNPPPLQEDWSTTVEGYPLGMGCQMFGSKIYFFGGQCRDLSRLQSFSNYSNIDYSDKVFVYDITNRSFEHSPTPMGSGKANPLVVEVGGRIYVLAGDPVRGNPDPVFEQFSPHTELWEGLPPPPFLNIHSKFYNFQRRVGYVIVGSKIHVSTSRSSFAYDVRTHLWEASSLFENVSAVPPMPWEENLDLGFDWVNYYGNDNTRCGPPFDFCNQATLFENDILICVSLRDFEIVAHQLCNDKVVNSQLLGGITIPPDTVSTCLAALGHGFFCLVCTIRTEGARKFTLSLQPFRVRRKLLTPYGIGDEFLVYNVWKAFDYQYNCPDGTNKMIWHPISCFVQ